MKSKQLILISIMLLLPCNIYTSTTLDAYEIAPSLTDINNAISNLTQAQSALGSLLETHIDDTNDVTIVNPSTSTENATNSENSAKETVTTTSISTTFYNDAGQSIIVQALINDKDNGAPVVIDYKPIAPYNSGIVTISNITDVHGQVSYNVTLPNSPTYTLVNVPYNAQKFPAGYQVNANATDIIVNGLANAYSINPVSTIFYNETGQSIHIQPLINGQKSGIPVDIDYSKKDNSNFDVVIASTMADQKLSYSITMPKSPNYTAVTVPYDAKKYPDGYQVAIDSNNIIVTGLTTPYTITEEPQITNQNKDETHEQITTAITNNAHDSVYVIMLDKNQNQINPTNFELESGNFSYIPNNVTAIKIVDQKNNIVIDATDVTLNTLYAITYDKNTWQILELPNHQAYQYKNATTLPLIVAITIGNIVHTEQIAPGDVYTQMIDPLATIKIAAHGNIGAISEPYNPAKSYNLTIDEKTHILTLSATSETNKTLTNNSGLPILIDAFSSDNSHDYKTINDGEQYIPLQSCINITAIPLLCNNDSFEGSAASCAITNQNGQLNLEF